jgi:curved DNA-binding protein CbpA
MSALSPTHYEVLGLTQEATQQEIKKRYRELARSHHPDVAPSPQAASRFREIAEANRILSDPAKRANYDAELKLSARLRVPSNPANNKPATPKAGETSQPPKPKHDPTVGEKRAAEVRQLLEDSRRSFALLRHREAEEQCRSAIKLDGRNTKAYELLGDILLKRRGPDEALAMYSFAVQLDRNNRDAQEKLDRIVGRPSGATMAGSAARARRPATAARVSFGPAKSRVGVTATCAVLLPVLLSVIGAAVHPTATSPWVFQWDPILVISLATCGMASGKTAAANNWLVPANAVLGGRGVPGAGPHALAPFLLVGSLLFFHAAALLYLLFAPIHGARSRSVLGSLLFAYVLLTLFAVAANVSGRYVMLFGGNIVFPCFLFGWFAGDKLSGRIG